jgi:pyruvate dehydrogenase (quinone)
VPRGPSQPISDSGTSPGRTDPEVPPIPPHVTYDQMKSTADIIVKGDPHGWHLFVEIAKNQAAELLPRAGLRSRDCG